MRLLACAFVLVALTCSAAAQSSMTLPAGFDAVDGNGATSFPFNNTNDHKWQWHYANSNFAGVTGPIAITDISVRASSPATVVGAWNFPSVDVHVGSAVTGYQTTQHDPVFANNVCSDLTLVRSGSWSGAGVPATANPTADWFSIGPLSSPFVFDPASGRDLIIQITKCGTVATLAASIDGASGSAGLNGGNRYGDTTNCAATMSSFSNNEFVPIVKIDYVMGGTPGVCTGEFQTNQAGSSMTLNGAPDPGPGVPIAAMLSVGQALTVDLSSTNTGNPWDIGFHVGAFSRAVSAGGWITPGFQVVNIDLSDPGFMFLNGGTFTGTSFANTSIGVAGTAGLLAGGQLAVVDVGQADGIALSHACDMSFQPCTGDDFELLPLGPGGASPGWTNPVAGTMPWTVSTGGTPSSGTGPTSASSGSNYVYCETSGTGIGATFTFDTCLFDATALTAFTLDFALSRIGATTGTLTVYQDDGLGTYGTVLTTYSGPDPAQAQLGTEWSNESVSFTPVGNVVAFRFEYVAGTSFTGDLAVDALAVN